MAADVHVLPVGDKWMVRREGTDEPPSTHSTQAEATDAGRAQAKRDKVELLARNFGRARVREQSLVRPTIRSRP